MNYNFTLIKTKANCETLIKIAGQTKEDLEFRRASLIRKQKSSTNNALSLQAEIQAITAEAAAVETAIVNLPDGEVKQEMVVRKTKLVHKLFLLSNAQNSNGVVSILDREFDIGCLDQQIEEAGSFINGVTAHMNSL